MSFFTELKRRNVIRVGIAYVIVAWLLAQVADLALDNFESPGWVIKTILLVLVLGFPLALLFAWAFEMTPEGIKKEKDIDRSQSITPQTGRKLDRAIIAVLVAVLGYFAIDKFLPGTDPESAATELTIGAGVDSAAQSAVQVDDKSLAVLPFAHRSPNPDDQFFTDGIHDDLLTRLAKQDAFKVISRTSVMEYRDTTKNMKQVGDELGVRHILEGGVQRAGSEVRINVQLIDAQTDKHLWAETYDRALTTDNLFDIQSEITSAIAKALHATLSADAASERRSAPTSNLAAYDFYLKGNQNTLGNSQLEWKTAVTLYEDAIRLDADFALAYVGLSKAYLTLYWSFGGDPAHRESSRIALDQAIALDPDMPEIQMAEGFYNYWARLDYDTALGFLDRAIEVMPKNAEAHMWRGWALRRAGHWESALESMRRSLELDPRANFSWLEYGQTLSYMHRFDKALSAINKARSLGGMELWARGYTTDIYLQQGDIQAALGESEGTLNFIDQSVRFTLWAPLLLARDFDAVHEFADAWGPEFEVSRQNYTPGKLLKATAYRLAGDTEAGRVHAAQAIKELQVPGSKFSDDYRKHFALAWAYSMANDRANTVKYAELGFAQAPPDAVENMQENYLMACALALVGEKKRALELLDPLLPGPSDISVRYVELDPHWDSLRADNDFKAMLNKYRDDAS